MDLIKKYIPETFYAELPDEERLKMLVKHWQRAIKVNQELEEKISKSAVENAVGLLPCPFCGMDDWQDMNGKSFSLQHDYDCFIRNFPNVTSSKTILYTEDQKIWWNKRKHFST